MNNTAHFQAFEELFLEILPPSSCHELSCAYEKLNGWLVRFSPWADKTVFNDLYALSSQASPKFLNHRNSSHFFRLILAFRYICKKLQQVVTFSPDKRQVEIRWIPATLSFPFSTRQVLGCVIGFNATERCEFFDEEHLLLTLQKQIPTLRLVKESSYAPSLQSHQLKLVYFELEKSDGSGFSSLERLLLKNDLAEKVKNSIQRLGSSAVLGYNEEEIYKNILVLSRELDSLQTIPQAYILLDRCRGGEVVFRVLLLYLAPRYPFCLQTLFSKCNFVSERVLSIKQLEGHAVEAQVFTLHLPLDSTLLRNDGSLYFYDARRKAAQLITAAIGEFRDYNGGMLLKQQEQLEELKAQLPEINKSNPELIDAFFYAITPLVKQLVLPQQILSTLFNHYITNKEDVCRQTVNSLRITVQEQSKYLLLHANSSELCSQLSTFLKNRLFEGLDLAYNLLEVPKGFFFNGVIANANSPVADAFIQGLKDLLAQWEQKINERKIIRIALERTLVSLDPRVGGDGHSVDILKFLFEGLTRLNGEGKVEHALAESIKSSADLKEYIFTLRPAFWNQGSLLSAYDFEYAWKKILSPNFKTAFAYLFYPIKNAKKIKEGLLPPEQLGVYSLDERTLKVELEHPAPYFLKLTALPLFSPVHHLVDQQCPQWPYQCGKQFPCNGAYQLKINDPTQGYQLIKNPFYWDSAHIAIDEIRFKVTKPLQALQEFQKKELDWIGNPFGLWDHHYQAGKDGKIFSSSRTSVFWLVLNSTSFIFQHLKLRQAIAYAIQRSPLTIDPHASLRAAYSVFPPHKNQQLLFPEHNKERARQLFLEAIQELGLEKKEVPPLNLICHEKGIQKNVALCLQKQFSEILDIECNLQLLPWNEQFSRMAANDFQMGLVAWVPYVDDPSCTLNIFKSAQQGLNFGKWEHPELIRILDLSDHETGAFKRSFYFQQAEEILSKEMPVIPLFYRKAQALVSDHLLAFQSSLSHSSFNFLKNGDLI